LGQIPVRREGDLLYGRGAVDAKGPLAAFIAAVAQVGPLPGKRLVVIGAVEEEAASSRGARHVVRRDPPTAAIIGEPSNWDRITLGYKGSLMARYTVTQAGEHSSGPSQNANEKAVAFWQQAQAHAEAVNGGEPRSFRTLDPTLRDMGSEHDGFRQEATVSIAWRVPLGHDVAALKAEIASWADEGEVAFVNEQPPFKAKRNTALVRAFLQGIRAEEGRPRFAVKHGTADMNIVGPVWGCPIVAYGPGDSNLDHTPNEHISLQAYKKAIEVLKRVLQLL
jgi:LysW-gamma-L-lysine carboxypeptidase